MAGNGCHDHVTRLPLDHVLEFVDLVELGKSFSLEDERRVMKIIIKKTGVMNDPLGQTQNSASSDHLKTVLFCANWNSEDVRYRTYVRHVRK